MASEIERVTMRIAQSEIDEILRDIDIEGFLKSGAPEDEYSSEAKTVFAVLSNFNSQEWTLAHIVSILTHVWKESFHLSEEDLKDRLLDIERAAKIIHARQ